MKFKNYFELHSVGKPAWEQDLIHNAQIELPATDVQHQSEAAFGATDNLICTDLMRCFLSMTHEQIYEIRIEYQFFIFVH